MGPIGDWLEDSVNAFWTGLSDFIKDPVGTLQGVADWVWSIMPLPLKQFIEFLKNLTSTLWQGFIAFLEDPIGTLQGLGNWIWNEVNTGLQSAREFLSGSIDWVWTQVSTGLGNLWAAISTTVGNISSAVTGAVTGLWDSLTGLAGDLLGGVAEALGSGLQGVFDWLLKHLTYVGEMIAGAMNAVKAAVAPVIGPFLLNILNAGTEGLIPGSPPKEVEEATASFSTALLTRLSEIPPKHKSPLPSLAELLAASAGVVGASMLTSFGMSSIATYLDMAHWAKMTGIVHTADNLLYSLNFPAMIGPIIFSNIYAGIIIPLRYRWNEIYTPMVPPSPDLIRMVVREAFVEEMVIKAPAVFASNMKYHGFSVEWSDRYWTAHFVPIALRQAYENLWRGHWEKKQFMRALHISDIHPMWREDIFKVAFRPPGVRELGYGYDTNLYSREDIVRYRRWGGLDPEDAEKAADSLIAYRTEAEREALRREAIADYAAGLDTQDQLRSNLSAIGGRPEIIDLWISRADYRATRDLILDRVKVAVSDYVKGWSSLDELRQDLITLGVTAERRAVLIEEAESKRKGTKRAESAEKKKVITVTRVRKARELGLLGDMQYVARLMDHGYTEEDARLDLAIELTPKPVTPEEVLRRRTTITSKLARAQRRWETRLAALQDQTDLTMLQLTDAGSTRDETLDVIDAQIAVYDLLIEEAPEEKKPALIARRVVLFQRREVTEARWADRISKLTAQHTDLVEEKTLMTRHRDEELGEYGEELKLLGVAA